MRPGRLFVGLLGAAALASACVAPDLRRGKAELARGESEAAEQDLKPLAEMGYADAKLGLARVYASRTDPASLQAAIQLYRELLADDPSVAVPLARTLIAANNPNAIDQAFEMLIEAEAHGDDRASVALLALYSEHPERDTHKRMPQLVQKVAKMKDPEAEAAIIKWYRRNALADEKAARQLITRCEKAKDRLPDCYVDLVRHYRATGEDKAVRELAADAMGRSDAGQMSNEILERVGWSLVSDDIAGKEYPEIAHPMLKKTAEKSMVGAVRLARLLIEYPYLDPEASPEKLLLRAADQGLPEADLALGRLYMDGKLAPADPARAVKHFESASATLPAAHYYLGRVYKRGHLGYTDPVLAARHFLTAARSGYVRADYELARMFSDNRGVKPNFANAFVFATLAAEREVPEAPAALQQIKAGLKAGQLQEAQRLLRMETAVREATPQTDPTNQELAPLPARAEASP
jgi:alginate biosynthesis protein AlgK